MPSTAENPTDTENPEYSHLKLIESPQSGEVSDERHRTRDLVEATGYASENSMEIDESYNF